jgi:hypothetical protein
MAILLHFDSPKNQDKVFLPSLRNISHMGAPNHLPPMSRSAWCDISGIDSNFGPVGEVYEDEF